MSTSPEVSYPGERLRALVTAVIAGDDELARELATGDVCPPCTALEAARWFVDIMSKTLGLEGEELAAHWSSVLIEEAS